MIELRSAYIVFNGPRRSGHDAMRLHEHDILPPAKRLKALESTSDEDSLDVSTDELVLRATNKYRDEVADSEEDVESKDDGQAIARLPTELESALPPVKGDNEAIAEYEAMRAGGTDVPTDLKGGINERSWTRRRSSIYVDAFNLALETVLANEGHLFDETEMEVFKQWKDLDYEAQYLYVRLFLRKTSTWHRINLLRYYDDVSDLRAAARVLQTVRQLPAAATQVNHSESAIREGTILEEAFSFANASEDNITTLEEASCLLNLEELKSISKEAKVQGKNKAELQIALRRMSQRQSGLGWFGLKRPDNNQTVAPKRIREDSDGDTLDQSLANTNRDKHFLHKILTITGPCIRLSLPVLKLFERVHLIFYRSTEWTEKSLTTIILAQISRRNFPRYIVSRSANIFPSRSELLEFEAALRTQFRVDNILEFSGHPNKEALEEVLIIFDDVYPRWKALLDEEQRKEDCQYESGEGAYLRRFSPAWVYTRIVHKGTYVLGRFKMYEREHAIIIDLLSQQLFHAARRGAWYQRKALLEEHYMSILQPPSGISDLEQRKQHWRRIALKTCEQGLQDKDCHIIYHYDLQKRVQKLEKKLKIPRREQHDFGHVLLLKPVEITVKGIQIKNLDRHSSRRRSGSKVIEERQRSTKTVWVDEREGGGECSVEDMCLSWYRSQGWKGYHAEGGIIRTLFAYLFYDILFIYIPNVFQTAYQTCPLDLHTDAFFPSRVSEINHRLAEIANGAAERLIEEVDARERERKTCIVGLNWDFDAKDLLEVVGCFDGAALSTVCKVMAQEYKVRGGGIPDLFLWDPVRKEVCFSEVKSAADSLSDTQRLWIHVLTGAGVRVELCNAVAREVRIITDG